MLNFCFYLNCSWWPLIPSLLLSLLFNNAFATTPVIYMAEQAETIYYAGKPRQDYYVELLQLALSYPCSQHYQLQASGLDLPKQRAFTLMNNHQGIDVIYGSASTERIKQYLAVPFPILRGLKGLRIALVSPQAPDVLKLVYSLPMLAQLRVGQFNTWSDTAILRANGFNVDAASTVEGLYQMLSKGRIDYFPRSVLEILHDQAQHAELQLQIDPYILLYYPTATYFYVAQDNSALAEALLCGLEQAQQDGSLDRLFTQYYGDLLLKLNITGRRVIKLQNPLLPAGVPLQRPELWLPIQQTDIPRL
jgi:ABC-type amino acid transport substrate-binding protein